MEEIIWTDEFSVGVARIDEQHKRLIQMINRLIAEPEAKTESEAVSELLGDMTKYAQVHHAEEEQLMQQHGYPGLEEHIAQHRSFRRKTVEFCSATTLGVRTVPDTMRRYLREWLVEHILKSDMAYKPFFHERGLK